MHRCPACGHNKPQTAYSSTYVGPTHTKVCKMCVSRQRKDPDWDCPTCRVMVFGSKDACFKCGTAKPRRDPAPQPSAYAGQVTSATSWLQAAQLQEAPSPPRAATHLKRSAPPADPRQPPAESPPKQPRTAASEESWSAAQGARDADDDRRALRAMNETLEEQVRVARRNEAKACAERDQMWAVLKDKTKELQEAKAEASTSGLKRDEAERQKHQARTQLEQAQQARGRLDRELAAARKEAAELRARLAAAQDSCDELQARLRSKERSSAKERRRDDEAAAAAATSGRNADEAARLATEAARLEAEGRRLATGRAGVEAARAEVERRLESAEARAGAALGRVEEVEEVDRRYRGQIERLERLVVELAAHKDAAEAEAAAATQHQQQPPQPPPQPQPQPQPQPRGEASSSTDPLPPSLPAAAAAAGAPPTADADAEDAADRLSFGDRLLAWEQGIHNVRSLLDDATQKPWKLPLPREGLVAAVNARVGGHAKWWENKRQGYKRIYAELQVSFDGEAGVDQGGLQASLYQLYFGQAFADPSLCERHGEEGVGLPLPAPAAPVEAMQACGRLLAKMLVDSWCAHGFAPFLWHFLRDSHEGALATAASALAQLRAFDAVKARSWALVLAAPTQEALDEMGLAVEMLAPRQRAPPPLSRQQSTEEQRAAMPPPLSRQQSTAAETGEPPIGAEAVLSRLASAAQPIQPARAASGDADGDMDDDDDDDDGTPLTLANRDAAVRDGCRHVLLVSRRRALEALAEGFGVAKFGMSLRLWSVPQLCALASGSHTFDGAALLGGDGHGGRGAEGAEGGGATGATPHFGFEGWPEAADAAEADGDSAPGARLRAWMLACIRGWEPRRCKQLLKFCTALEVLPDPFHPNSLKARPIQVVLDTTRPIDLGRLPRASTCTRELFLPPYDSREMLEQRLVAAIETWSDDAFLLP